MFNFAKRIVLFLLVNILVMATISIILGLLGVGPYLNRYGMDYQALAVFCLVWGMGGAFISLMLSRIMAKWMMGVQLVDPRTHDSELQWLVQTVHNLARSAGLPAMPEVGVYESPELNAFATGPTRSRALVAVSSGLLTRMNKDEIEGVLGHEITHVANGDMVTMTLLQGVVNAFVMFLARALAFVLMNSGRDREEGSSRTGGFAYYMLVMLFEMVFMVLGMIVIARFSRYREFRADKGGATFAGRDKMISALQKLRLTYEGAVDSSATEPPSIQAFKIAGKPSKFAAMFSTHPPLEERIARLARM